MKVKGDHLHKESVGTFYKQPKFYGGHFTTWIPAEKHLVYVRCEKCDTLNKTDNPLDSKCRKCETKLPTYKTFW